MPNNHLPNVAMLSLWRNDTQRNLHWRARHLLSKTYPALHFIWVVGDCDDDTYGQLLEIVTDVNPWRRVDLIRADSRIEGMDPATRRKRLAHSANAGVRLLRKTDNFLLIHESDLISPPDIAELYLEHERAGREVIAGFPILPINETQAVFYDVWGYRANGHMFSNSPPFHEVYRQDGPFEVESVGSCWMLPAEDARQGAGFDGMACVGFCNQLRERGRHIWVDPRIIIVQPNELWEPHSTAD